MHFLYNFLGYYVRRYDLRTEKKKKLYTFNFGNWFHYIIKTSVNGLPTYLFNKFYIRIFHINYNNNTFIYKIKRFPLTFYKTYRFIYIISFSCFYFNRNGLYKINLQWWYCFESYVQLRSPSYSNLHTSVLFCLL